MSSKPHRLNSPGQKYHAFTLIRAIEIPELQCFLRELVHEPSGAHVIAIANEDPENLFSLSFKTLPERSDGVAHILEHTVLCGSEKFPVKDPFFAMSRRSLNTFMNALTGADFTCYPAATQVHKDFYNLLDVYLDAVFHPRLNKLSFLQEGHRLEFAHAADSESPLEYKGIVYNEMKGAMSSPNARLSEVIHASLFPDVSYGVNSGGDPKVIPQLTYEELCNFHHQYYNPSRCLFFFYGNMPLEGHLDFIAERTLNAAKKAAPLDPIPLQPRFQKPKYVMSHYPVGADEDINDKTIIAFAWLTCSILDQETVLALSILETILLDNDASPLKKALLKSGLCKQVSSFIDDELNEIPWGITLKGCNPENADAIEKLIKETLLHIIYEGIPLEKVENAIHQSEFHRTEITGDHAPFGLSLFFRSALLKQHGANPEYGLMIHSLFNKLRQRIVADPQYLGHIIRDQILNNPHHVRVIMKPDPQLAAKELAAEKERLNAIAEGLSPEDKEQLIEKAAELSRFQKEQENIDIDILPKVTLQDVPQSARNYILTREKVGILEVFHHAVFTNDIVYADLVLDLPDLPEEDLPYLSLWSIVLTQMGCSSRDYTQNLDYIQANTGGIGAGISLNVQATDFQQFKPTINLRGKALHRKVSKLFPLMQQTLMDPDFTDLPRLKEILFKHYTALESQLNQNALKYAINLSASSLTVAGKVANDLYGLNFFWKLRDIVRDFDRQAPFIISKLQSLHKKITGLQNPHLVLSCDNATYNELKKHQFYDLQQMDTNPFDPWKGNYPITPVYPQGRVIASPVAFIGKVFTAVSYVHPQAPALNIASHILDNVSLHTMIREQGGAYGGGAVSNPSSGSFYFYSYRDPNILRTVKAFSDSVTELLNGDFEDSDLDEAKLEIIQSLDAPISPGSRADVAYARLREGKTLEMRQAFRNKMLTQTSKDVIEAVHREIVPHINEGATVVFAGRDLLEKENAALKESGQPELPIVSI